MREVLQTLRTNKLFCKPAKCVFGAESVKFLGYVVSGFSLAPDEEKVAAVKNWPVPRTVSEIRRFLGFSNFFRRFIKKYSDVARPLEELTGRHTRFTWSPSCQVAFDRLKDLLLSAPVLKLANASKPFRVITDASDCAVGGVLLQEEEAGQWHPVAYTSRRLSAAEMNYHAMERETLAVVHALRVWKLYLYNSFEVLTDNMGSRTSNPRRIYPNVKLGGWSLSEFDFTILHRPGANNMADALSRRPDLDLYLLTSISKSDSEENSLTQDYQQDRKAQAIIDRLSRSPTDAFYKQYRWDEASQRLFFAREGYMAALYSKRKYVSEAVERVS